MIIFQEIIILLSLLFGTNAFLSLADHEPDKKFGYNIFGLIFLVEFLYFMVIFLER